MNYKFLFYIFCIFLFFEKNALADEINIDSSKIKVIDEGNIINALNIKASIPLGMTINNLFSSFSLAIL